MSVTDLHLMLNNHTEGRVGSPGIPIATSATTPVEDCGIYTAVQATLTGVVCGQCSYWLEGNRLFVRHASVDHVRACFDIAEEAREIAEAECLAEQAVERYFEGAYRMPDVEDIEEEARERWYASLRGE